MNTLGDADAVVVCFDVEVPVVLAAMWCALVRAGGLFVEGIFRVAPEAADAAAVEKALGKGKLDWDQASPYVLAHLIKKFLRMLPDGGLLGAAPLDALAAVAKGNEQQASAACARVVDALSLPCRSTLQWLVRVLVDVAACSEKNKMVLSNLTLVLAPNLFGSAPAGAALNPMEELQRVEYASHVLQHLVEVAAAAAAAGAATWP